jgi:hypothetical protein
MECVQCTTYMYARMNFDNSSPGQEVRRKTRWNRVNSRIVCGNCGLSSPRYVIIYCHDN